jgi:hypothetical protein
MGKIIELDFQNIIPSQKNLIRDDMEEFLLSYLKDNSKLVIVPVASWIKDASYHTLIDGYHRTSSLYLLNKLDKKIKLYGWLTNSCEDFIQDLPKEFYQEGNTLASMNGNIRNRFNDVFDCPYSNLEELINQYYYMQSPEIMLGSFGSQEDINRLKLNLKNKLVHN